jgi:hypothetical protein
MNCFASDPRSARLTRLAPLLFLLGAAGCSNNRLDPADARRLIESSARFTAPNVLSVRPQYCATVDAPDENVTAGSGRLKALEAAGAIRIERRAAAPNECTSLAGPMRERLVIALADGSAAFHPQRLDTGGWEFALARRRFVSVAEITFNSGDDPTIAHAVYRWAWRAELLGQLMQVSEDPVNAQATFVRQDSAWAIRDVGF